MTSEEKTKPGIHVSEALILYYSDGLRPTFFSTAVKRKQGRSGEDANHFRFTDPHLFISPSASPLFRPTTNLTLIRSDYIIACNYFSVTRCDSCVIP